MVPVITQVREFVHSSDLIENILGNYFSSDEREEFLDYMIGSYDLEEFEEDIKDYPGEYLCEYLASDVVISELEQWMNGDYEFENWLKDEYCIEDVEDFDEYED